MKMNARQFRSWKNKSITLVGMSGVGKTHLSAHLRRQNWFHYSADYRIGTRYLGEPILDQIKSQAMQVPFLRDLLRSDSIYIASNITVDNLKPVLGELRAQNLPAFSRDAAKSWQAWQSVEKIFGVRDDLLRPTLPLVRARLKPCAQRFQPLQPPFHQPGSGL